jgi:hypothetical protein
MDDRNSRRVSQWNDRRIISVLDGRTDIEIRLSSGFPPMCFRVQESRPVWELSRRDMPIQVFFVSSTSVLEKDQSTRKEAKPIQVLQRYQFKFFRIKQNCPQKRSIKHKKVYIAPICWKSFSMPGNSRRTSTSTSNCVNEFFARSQSEFEQPQFCLTRNCLSQKSNRFVT